MRRLAFTLTAILTLVPAGSAAAASSFYIRGGGNGHGVGMSQYGAYGYALHGKDYRSILAHYYQGTTISTTNPDQTVRVLISTGSAAFSGATRAGAKRLRPEITYRVRALADGSLILASPSGRKVGRFAAPLTVQGPGPLQLAGAGAYRGSLQFRPDGAGGVETVDAIGLDDYLRGVIAAEMPASWAPAALQAQAVAARTYAITTDTGGTAFDLYPDTRSQMYGGVSAETTATDAAVAATRGQIVTYRGAPAVSYFFSSSGGHTESVEDAWPGSVAKPWLRGVPDPYDGVGGDPYHRWLVTMSSAAATAKLGRLVKGNLIGINVIRHGSSPRIVLAAVLGSRGSSTVTGSELQRAFGLLSTYATFTTITTLPGPAPALPATLPRNPAAPGTRIAARALAALAPLLHALLGPAGASLHGSVFPARQGDLLSIQRKDKRGWRTVARTRVGKGGLVAVALGGPGTYRLVYEGLDGPAVSVS